MLAWSAKMMPSSAVVKALVGADDAVLGTYRLNNSAAGSVATTWGVGLAATLASASLGRP